MQRIELDSTGTGKTVLQGTGERVEALTPIVRGTSSKGDRHGSIIEHEDGLCPVVMRD